MLARTVISAAFLLLPLPIRIPHKHGPEVLKQIKDVTIQDIAGPVGHLAADVQGQRIFLAATGANTIEVFDAQTLRHLNTIEGLSQPDDLVYLPESNRLMVTNGADGSLRTYDAKTLKPLDSKLLGGDAGCLRVTPNGKAAIVGWGVGALAIFDTQSGKRTDVQLRSHPESFQVDSSGNRIFVNLPGLSEIAVVDRRSQIVSESWSVRQNQNVAMAIDDADRRLFVVSRRPARLLVVNMDDGSIITSLGTVGDAADIFWDKQRKQIYVIGGEGQIAAYKQTGADEYSALGRTDTMDEGRTGLFVPEWNRVYVVARNRPPGFPLEMMSFGITDAAQ